MSAFTFFAPEFNARLLALRVKIANVAYDLPFTVSLLQSEHISELVVGPIVELPRTVAMVSTRSILEIRD